MTQGAISFFRPFSEAAQHEITTALGLTDADLDRRCPIQIVQQA